MFKSLSDLAQVNPSLDLPAGITVSTDVSFIPMSDVTESGEWTGRQVRKLDEVRNGFTSFGDDDILIAKITPCFENGKGAHVSRLKNGVGFGSTEFHVLRARPDCHARYLHHIVQSTRFRRKGEVFMTGSAGQKRVPREFFDAFEVPLLNLAEQQKVAQVLDTLDTTIRQTEAIIAKLKQVKQGLLHDLLTRGIDANGELRPPQSEAPPKWRIEPMGALMDGAPRNGIYKPASDIGAGTLLIGQTAFTSSGSVDASLARRARLTKAEQAIFGLRRDDLLVSRVFATREGVGQPVLVPDFREPAVFESNMMRVRANADLVRAPYLFHWLKHQTSRAWLMSRAFASNQASINRETLCGVPVHLPPVREQDQILSIISAEDARLACEVDEMAKLKQLKSGLMDDLLTGRVRVTPLLAQATIQP